MPAASSHKYLYERLDNGPFQKMCGALVASRWEGVEVFPTGQADEGRDITAGMRGVVLQVKHTKNPAAIKNPVGWLEAAIKGEEAKIKRLVAKGCQQYILMTNIEGSAYGGTGDRDKMHTILKTRSEALGVDMSVMWCSDIDAWVDTAGPDLKLSYIAILAGSDLLVAMLQSTQLAAAERRSKDFLLDYIRTCWAREKVVKFTQAELRSNLLTDLFVDVTGDRTRAPKQNSAAFPLVGLGGFAAHVVDTAVPPFTLVEGIPGQGKSTAAQYVCQVYRADFLGRDSLKGSGETCPQLAAAEVRLPIRIDLADYAIWLSGLDPFNRDSEQDARKAKPRANAEIEAFLVKHFVDVTTGYDLKVGDIRDMLDRFATFVVFDGLDEVANVDVRARVVKEIDGFLQRRAMARPGNMRILVTTRPNASALPEPAPDLFQRLRLNPLDESLRKRYLRRWAKAHVLDSRDLRAIERIFGERTAAPHVAQLANNPMQLALLLHLIKTKRESLPSERTALYRQYMDLFLEREVEKSTAISSVVKEYRTDIEEGSAYIGWYMQGRAEVDAASTRLPETQIVRVMTQYLAGIGRHAPVNQVFKAMKDRVWVLTSKQTGTYEFDVQPIREYVTARFLHDYASPLDGSTFHRREAVKAMLPRAYWMNTARFLAGHFPDSQLSDLADAILERLEDPVHTRQVRTTAWALLADGVFKNRPQPQKRLAEALADDITVALLSPEDPSVEVLTPDFGGRDLSSKLLDMIAADPSHRNNVARADVAASVVTKEEHVLWWRQRLKQAMGTDNEVDWLRIGCGLRVGKSLPVAEADRLTLAHRDAAAWALTAGIEFSAGGAADRTTLSRALAGLCSGAEANNTGEAADLLNVFSPLLFRTIARAGTIGVTPRRSDAMKRLRERDPRMDRAMKAMRVQKNTKRTTSRWVNPAVALDGIYGGPHWLLTELAATSFILDPHHAHAAANLDKNRPAFGPNMHCGNWVTEVRLHAADSGWWRSQHALCTDDHSKAAWSLALAMVAPKHIVEAALPDLDQTVADLEDDMRVALLATSGRLGSEFMGRRLRGLATPDVSPATRVLLAHHAEMAGPVLGTVVADLAAMADLPAGGYVAATVATQLAVNAPSVEHYNLVARFGTSGETAPKGDTVSEQAAVAILRDAANFPPNWVRHADEALARKHALPPLRTEAEAAWAIP